MDWNKYYESVAEDVVEKYNKLGVGIYDGFLIIHKNSNECFWFSACIFKNSKTLSIIHFKHKYMGEIKHFYEMANKQEIIDFMEGDY